MSQNPPVTGSSFELKHRIVGALILIVLGVVVVPMILSGSEHSADLTMTDADANNPNTKVFISKITPINGVTPVVKRESKRSSDVAGTAPKPAANEKSIAVRKPTVKTATAEPVAKTRTQQPASSADKTKRKDAGTEEERAANAETVTKTDDDPIERGWIVRIGTFSKPENAARIMSSIRELGFEPSSERVNSSRGVLTRVWVGPYAKRVEAGRVRTRIQQTTGEKGLIAAFP